MAKNEKLSQAKKAKQDEFYTQFSDIQKEMNAYLDFSQDVFRGKTVQLCRTRNRAMGNRWRAGMRHQVSRRRTWNG